MPRMMHRGHCHSCQQKGVQDNANIHRAESLGGSSQPMWSGHVDEGNEYKAYLRNSFVADTSASLQRCPVLAERPDREFESGRMAVLGELVLALAGLSPNDPKLEPYFALAEQLDIPVGIHTGSGPPRVAHEGTPLSRAALGNPLLLEEVLVRHPKLRVYLMHAGEPWYEGTVAIMTTYPQVYADLGVLDWVYPPDVFYEYLQRLIRRGLDKQLMFGSDQMVWPEMIGRAIASVESAFLRISGRVVPSCPLPALDPLRQLVAPRLAVLYTGVQRYHLPLQVVLVVEDPVSTPAYSKVRDMHFLQTSVRSMGAP